MNLTTPQFADTEKRSPEIHISEYLGILYKRRTFIILFTFLFIVIVMVRTFQMVPLYQASSKIVVEAQNQYSPITGKRTDYANYSVELLNMGTHFKLIKSKTVMAAVVEDLELDERKRKKRTPGLFSLLKQLKAQLIDNIKSLLPDSEDDFSDRLVDPATRRKNANIRRLKASIAIKQVKKTRLILISAKDENPKYAAEIANAVAREYIEFDRTNRASSSRKNLNWLNSELYDLRKELEDNERAFFEYKDKHKVFSMEGKQKVAGQKIAEFNTRYLDTRNRRLELDTKIVELQRHLNSATGLVQVRSLISNELIESIYKKIVDLELDHTKLSKIYRSKHPKIIQVASEIDKARLKLAYELKKELANLKSERTVIIAREKSLEKTIGEFEQDALDYSSNELTYTILQRNVTTSQKLYDMLLSRIKESDILKNDASTNIRIVEQADIPLRPVSPRKGRNFLVALIFGLFSGCLLSFFFEYMDQTLRTMEDAQSYLDLPVLAVIPEA